MNEPPERHSGEAMAGYAVMLLPLLGLVVAFHNRAFESLGWRGGQYSQAYLATVAFALLAGARLRIREPGSPWRSFGHGMILAGVTGLILMVVIVVLLGRALSGYTFVS
jgi:hypothetical protein